MNEKYTISDILSAVEFFLENKRPKLTGDSNKKKINDEVPLKLTDGVNVNKKKKKEDIPKNTEQIIIQAEKYLKK